MQGRRGEIVNRNPEGGVMNREILSGKWKQLKGEVKRKWGKLTDDDLMTIEGNFDKLAGRLEERYGRNREELEQEIDEFLEETEIEPRRSVR
jgi:uncharacterized protein YjbJ (UPF0337 family)